MNLEGWRIMATKASQRNWMVNTNGGYWSILNGLYKQKEISNKQATLKWTIVCLGMNFGKP